MNNNEPILPGHPEWPMAWTRYVQMISLEEDVERLLADGVGLIQQDAGTPEEARTLLELARRTGIKIAITLPDVTEHKAMVERAGLEPVPALMIGGAYRGLAIDRHLFSFTPEAHEIVLEPPVYSRQIPYTRRNGPHGDPADGEPIGHYYPDMGAPLRAEVIVPLKPFDGQQHLQIVPATITQAPPGTLLEVDSTTGLPETSEIANRRLYRVTFDLTGLDGARLDQVSLAVYWPYDGTDQYWMFREGHVSARAESTQQALRAGLQETLAPWIEANGGTFPADTVIAMRYGDECFYVTGHLNGPAVSYPLWDYAPPAIRAFHERAGEIAYPRTWGFPEVYGPDAYAWWLYTLHEGCARLCAILREEIAEIAPGLLLFRNQTRMGVFDLSNDHDGSGQELLAQNVDVVHLDPYPAGAQGYDDNLVRDMTYCAGLARRYERPLVPWMQAHTYLTYSGTEGMQHVSPADVDRMAKEQWAQGVDAIMWLGWGSRFTFPDTRPDSWQRAVEFHRRLAASPPPKPEPRLAVLRPYRSWALSSQWQGQMRNPADWLLQQLLEVWAVQHGQPYDVFELPPAMGAEERDALRTTLAQYPFVVSTEPWDGAWVIGQGTVGTTIDPGTAPAVRAEFEQEIKRRR